MKLFKKEIEEKINNDKMVGSEMARIMQELQRTDPSSELYMDLLKQAKELNSMRMDCEKVSHTKKNDRNNRIANFGTTIVEKGIGVGTTVFVIANVLEFEKENIIKSKLMNSMVMKFLKF